MGGGFYINHPIYDKTFKSIFDLYPQGMLDIIYPLVMDHCPKVIIELAPEELLNEYGEDFLKENLKELLKKENFKLHFHRSCLMNSIFLMIKG